MTPLNVDSLQAAVAGSAAAFRCRRRLQPAGGAGDKVFPPTFAGAVYAIEQRRVPGREGPVTCVLLDSVQSQANRMELALQEAVDAGKITLPLVVVDFSDYDPTGDMDADIAAGRLIERVGKITSLQVPHRLADAILRDSEHNGVPFRKSDKGKALNVVSSANATPVFELCPTALVFGMWDSTGPKGGLGAKFERAMVSEIVGIGAEWRDDYRARGVRRDPLEISKNVLVLRNEDKSLKKVAEGKEKGALRPSEINHSSVPFESPNSGLTIEYAEQTTTLSLICLRRLCFPIGDRSSAEADVAARSVLAALGLTAATLAFEAGTDLRSRCLLWPDGPMVWELLDRPGAEPQRFTLTTDTALALLRNAVAQAKRRGLPWPEAPVQLKPSSELVNLVRLSQLAAKESSEAA
ncbi:MAG TPA: type I-U CRISPR-associated RAMP protein Csb1/Cas7u [Vicinamibacterales bacterium]|nr:type I-U CRISPR-associated RAMP protein Csb1/Cas7u [Vicinamibacterales bacterium]